MIESVGGVRVFVKGSGEIDGDVGHGKQEVGESKARSLEMRKI
jgi:hypothetical protein